MDTKAFIKTLPKGACRPCGEGLYSLIARSSLGEVTARQLETISGVVREYGLPGIRVTGRQQIQLLDIPEEKLREVVERLGEVGDNCQYFVQSCPGNRACRFGIQDSIEMGEMLKKFLNQFTLSAKLKSGVAGCAMCCTEPFVRDVGMIGTAKGWNVAFGGNAGRNVRKGDLIARGVTAEIALEVIGSALGFYAENAKKKERTARFVDRVGIDAVLKAVEGKSFRCE